ncbi:MAG: hypothetical protein ABR526_02425 [Chthoniobacterales bacterium]
MIQKVEFGGHANCLRIANNEVDLIVTTDIGPRILRYGFIGQENTLGEYPDLITPTEWGDWKPWGGHRLWVAPEEMPLSYAPDNSPIHFETIGDHSVRLTQPTDRAGFEKQISVELNATGTSVAVHHRIVNRNDEAVSVAPWAITIMRGGGTTYIPQEPFRSHDDCLVPARSLVLWYFTDLTDPRIQLGQKLIRLSTDAAKRDPQKIGAANQQGWCAYHVRATRTLFLKRFSYDAHAAYPDFGANIESYAAGDYMEVETLGGLVDLAPGAPVDHTETWQLFGEIGLGETDDEIEPAIKALVETA